MANDPLVESQSAPSETTPEDPEYLGRVRRMYDDARSLLQIPRQESAIDDDYYHGHQFTPAEMAILNERGQPPIATNRVQPGVDGVLGVLEQGKTKPRALMRNPPSPKEQPPQQGQPPQKGPVIQDADAGDVASMTLRYISDTTHFDATKLDCAQNFFVQGTMAAIVEVGEDLDVMINQIRWEDFFHDPRARRNDLKDARYLGTAIWQYADYVEDLYPEKAKGIQAFVEGGGQAGIGFGLGAFDVTWEDRPDYALAWVDRKQRRVMVVELYHQERGEWQRCVFWGGGILEKTVSPYQDDKGHPICPIEAHSAYVDQNNNRYGIVRGMRAPQDEINMRRSKLLHLLNVRQVQQVDPNAPPIDADTARSEAARPDGVIPTGWQIVPMDSRVQGQFELLQEAKNEIERLGPNPAILGRQGADASGRAQQIRQQAGLTEFARLLGRFTDWERRIYIQGWNRCRQFWTAEKWVRITNEEGAPQYVRINEPDQVVQGISAETGQMETKVLSYKNHIAKMDVDIVLDSVPDTATLQQEIYQELMQLIPIYGPQAVPFKLALLLSPIPKHRELVHMYEDMQAEQAQAQMQMAQRQAQFAEAKIVSDVQNKNADTSLKVAQAKKTEIEGVEAAIDAHRTAMGMNDKPPPGQSSGASD